MVIFSSSCSKATDVGISSGNSSGTTSDTSTNTKAGTTTGTTFSTHNVTSDPSSAEAFASDSMAPAVEPYKASLLTSEGEKFKPLNVITTDKNTFFLSGDALFIAARLPEPARGGVVRAKKLLPPLDGKGALPIRPHEFANFVVCSPRNSVIILDKSGDLFEYSLSFKKWSVLRANVQISSSPDPEFIDLCLIENGRVLNLLDPERNQIWRLNLPPQPGSKVSASFDQTFPEILPWRLKPGEASVAECISIFFDQRYYLLKQSGIITTILPSGRLSSQPLQQTRLTLKPTPARIKKSRRYGGVRASRMVSAAGDDTPLYVVERQNNRVLVVNKTNGTTRQFLFPDTSNLRGLTPDKEGFWIIDNDQLAYCQLSKAEALSNKINGRKLDERLAMLSMPIKGMRLPGHAGVFPGARRLYRHGVHEGLDFFNDRGHVAMNTPVLAAGPGKIIRADANFSDMTRSTFNRVMNDCVVEHRTSDSNEDLFRGCQVWVDHGDNLITRYAHLNKINPNIKVGQTVRPGDLIGFVGVSGTGQNLPGRTKYPHLHFEIWVDGKYLGYGLTPSETVGIFEDIFESAH